MPFTVVVPAPLGAKGVLGVARPLAYLSLRSFGVFGYLAEVGGFPHFPPKVSLCRNGFVASSFIGKPLSFLFLLRARQAVATNCRYNYLLDNNAIMEGLKIIVTTV
jgi:hypothetical protein